MVQRLKIDPKHPDEALLAEARDVLAAGGLVILPTETVYGIACNPSVPGAFDRLLDAKGRDRDKPVARLASSPEQVKVAAKEWNAGLQALSLNYWPGPLTIVLETNEGWMGYRIPNHAVPLKLAEMIDSSLALTSANASGDADARTADQAVASVAADLVLDGGPSAEKAVPSTVVKVDGANIECLREGRVPFVEVQTVFREGLNS